MVQATGLNDLGFKGNSYTWANKRQGQAYVAARLDCALANANWLDNLDDPTVTHLPKLSSDHSPYFSISRGSFLSQKYSL